MENRTPKVGEIWEIRTTKYRVLVLNADTVCVTYYTRTTNVHLTTTEKFIKGADPVDEYDLDPLIKALNENHTN